MLPNRIGKYEIENVIGTGGMSTVYKARHPLIRRVVAIKLLSTHLIHDEDFMVRFRREAENLASLKHPNIVQVFDFEELGDIKFIVMEYIDGDSLAARRKSLDTENRKFQFDQVAKIVRSIGNGLAYSHSKGLAHGDIKPGNIMLENTGRVVLTDFGLSRLVSQSKNTQTLTGTPLYMAPELMQGAAASIKTDIYSLGIVLYELLGGDIKQAGGMLQDIFSFRRKSPFRPIHEVNPVVSADLDKVIQTATSREPEDRFGTLNDFMSEFDKCSPDVKTALLSKRLRARGEPGAQTDGLIDGAKKVTLHLIETGQSIQLTNLNEYIVGRSHPSQALIPDIDLTEFDAYESGVSRLHATLRVGMGSLTVEDMKSTNGTWLWGERLPSETPVILKDGDVLSIGKFKIKVYIY